MYKSIIVAIDLNHADRGIEILNKAKALVADDGSLHLVHVLPHIPGYVGIHLPEEFIAQSRLDAEDQLRQMAKDMDKKTRVVIRSGQPHDEILSEADAQTADLIVVGSHHPELTDYLIGSTAGRVVRHAQCSVLVDRQ
jgi:nucleotide-binding universal stress UspA family protein